MPMKIRTRTCHGRRLGPKLSLGLESKLCMTDWTIQPSWHTNSEALLSVERFVKGMNGCLRQAFCGVQDSLRYENLRHPSPTLQLKYINF